MWRLKKKLQMQKVANFEVMARANEHKSIVAMMVALHIDVAYDLGNALATKESLKRCRSMD